MIKQTTDLKKITERIRKLMALAQCEGATEAEATRATEMVQALLAEQNLKMADH
jgi:hypothetical protein